MAWRTAAAVAAILPLGLSASPRLSDADLSVAGLGEHSSQAQTARRLGRPSRVVRPTKYKRQKGKPPVCKYVVNPGDFEIPNEEGQDGDHLTGYHCGVTKDGGRTDTVPDDEDEPSIKGRIKGDTATVDVHSAYSDAVVTVRLALNGRNLEWKMVEVKKRGEYYVPDTKQTLRRCHFDTKKKDWVED